MIVTTADLFKLAYGNYAVGAYNINNMEQALGLFQGGIKAQAPLIIQLSKGARQYAGATMIEGIIRAAERMYPEAVFAVHLDHGDEAMPHVDRSDQQLLELRSFRKAREVMKQVDNIGG